MPPMHKRLLILLLFLGSNTLFAADGAMLYQRHCEVCHGQSGDGGVGVPLNLDSFQGTVNDKYIRETIRHGRPGRVMPGFASLSEDELDALVTHVRSWSEARPPAFSDEKISGDVEKGKTLYASHCAACHGANGEGGHGTGVTMSRKRDLPILAPGLNNAGFLKSASDAQMVHTLRFGRPGTPMISFLQAGMSNQDINDVVAYIRSWEATADDRHSIPLEEPVIMAESSLSLEETVEAVKNAVQGKNFRLIRVQNMDNGFVPEGEEKSRQVIIYFCNFNFLFDALGIDPRVGMFLPCRVTVTEQNGKVMVMAANPMNLSRLFNNADLDKACEEMKALYRNLIEEATF